MTDVGGALLDDPARTEGVTMVGLDETVFLHARRKRRRSFVTGVVDVGTGALLDVFEGRDAKDLRRWMAMQSASWLAQIEVVSIDPHESYRSAVTRSDPFSLRPSPWRDVTLVVDPFHVVRLANQAVTRCRQRVQQATFERRGWQGDPLYEPKAGKIVAASSATGSAPRRSHSTRRASLPGPSSFFAEQRRHLPPLPSATWPMSVFTVVENRT